MKKQAILILACLALAFTSCKKDNDLTSDIVGKYTSGSGSGEVEVIVNRVDNSTVSLTVGGGSVGAAETSTHATTKMNSKTSFTLNTVSSTAFGYTTTYSGTGTNSGNNIVVVRHVKVVKVDDGSTDFENDETFTASK